MKYSVSERGITIQIGRKELEEAAQLKKEGNELVCLPIYANVKGYKEGYSLRLNFERAEGEGADYPFSEQHGGIPWILNEEDARLGL